MKDIKLYYVNGKRVTWLNFTNAYKSWGKKFKSSIFEIWRIANRIIYVFKITF